MPNRIEVMKVVLLDYDIYFSKLDKFIAFAYPGMYAGLGNTRSEALHMAQLRFGSGRKTFFGTRDNASESDWVVYTCDREEKFDTVYKTKGVSDDSCWSADNVEKGNT